MDRRRDAGPLRSWAGRVRRSSHGVRRYRSWHPTRAFTQIDLFSRTVLRRPLRPYQIAPARAIVDSVLYGRGLTIAVMMARQSGKNETAAHVEAFLLNAFRRRGGVLVKAAPTYRPQVLNSIRRLESVMEGSILSGLAREGGHTLRLGNARVQFYSATPRANVVGATASVLLEGDEAQDIDEDKWDKDFRPMASSNNATTVLWGTAWTSRTLLAHSIRELRRAERRDGRRRVFLVDWQEVARYVPSYGRYVRGEVERLGRQHPLIRTQYCLEEIDDDAGMFPPSVRALMQGSHDRQRYPTEGRDYALLVDVAGEAENPLASGAVREHDPRRDSTALTVVEVSHTDLGLARYLVMDRYVWTGTAHHELYGAIAHLADHWGARRVVVDATGVGAGLASWLQKALGSASDGGRVQPVTFSASTKSALGWTFLGICTSGRFLDHADDGSAEYLRFWREVRAATYEVVPGPSKQMRWGVEDPAIHDDLLISAALCAVLEEDALHAPAGSQVIEADDPLGRVLRAPGLQNGPLHSAAGWQEG